MLHPDAFRYRSAEAPAFQGALGAAEQVSHFLFCDLVDVTGTFGFHGMVSTPPVAAGRWSVLDRFEDRVGNLERGLGVVDVGRIEAAGVVDNPLAGVELFACEA